MTHLRKLRLPLIFKWVSLNFPDRLSKSPIWPTWSFPISQNFRHYCTEKAVHDFDEKANKISRSNLKETQDALLEYLHSTRSLQFLDADYMSKNSPQFVEQLFKGVKIEEDARRSLSRYLRYHPINEFEPFFESVGLNPCEYAPLLPRNLIFLSDDELLLENYHVLCNYGIARNKIGKIYKVAKQVFQYDYGVLPLKLRAYEELGLCQLSVAKFVTSCPFLLVGDANVDFVKVLEKLRALGCDASWAEERLCVEYSYNWGQMFELLCLFSKLGCSDDHLQELIIQYPDILFEGSGNKTMSIIVFLLKFGLSTNQIRSVLVQLPQIQVGKFLLNLRNCFLFFNEIELEAEEVGKIVRSHPLFLGSCVLKKTNSILAQLNVGKKRLCGLIQENPLYMKNLILGRRLLPLPNSGEDLKAFEQKTGFLLNLGFKENSEEMKAALKVFRGKGDKLQERFDGIVEAGLDWEDVSEMIKLSPQILNQSKDVIKRKIDFLVNELGFPISSLVNFASYLNYTTQRVKLRFSMYNWLVNQGCAYPNLALSTIIACSDSAFIRKFVMNHPMGPQVWQNLKNEIYSSER